MKNIHILPTENSSRLQRFTDVDKIEFELASKDEFFNKGMNIYITFDEEIKEGDWFYNIRSLKPEPFKACENGYGYVNCSKYSHYRMECKKIILTTDQDLIKDGVQAIDDEFLEWFVKNPSCEKIEVNKSYSGIYYIKYPYKIIIPKEEPKQYPIGGYAPGFYSCKCVNCKIEFTGDKRAFQCEPCAIKTTKEEPKQETLEEAVAKKLYPLNDGFQVMDIDISEELQLAFLNGAKWQQENIPICIYAENIYCHIENGVVIVEKNDKSVISYSDEEVLDILREFYKVSSKKDFPLTNTIPLWFEQFKRNKMKETLEDFCTRELSNFNDNVRNTQFDLGFRTGAIIGLRFPKERSYSEEEARTSLTDLSLVNPAHLTMTSDGYGEFPDSYKLTEKGINYIIEQLTK
jgi:hypothetical protein